MSPMKQREHNWEASNYFKDDNGQAHFPNKKLESGETDLVRLGKKGGYYPKCGGK